MKKYIQKQKYYDCQLVSAVNACIFHGLPVPSKEEYEALVDLTDCRHAAPLHMDTAHYRLGLRSVGVKSPTLKWMETHLPVDLCILRWGYFHNVLVVKIEGNRCWVVNYYSVRGSNRMKIMPWNELKNLHLWLWKKDNCGCYSLQKGRGGRIR